MLHKTQWQFMLSKVMDSMDIDERQGPDIPKLWHLTFDKITEEGTALASSR